MDEQALKGELMVVVEVWIPHGKKKDRNDRGPTELGWDPPLTDKARSEDVPKLTEELVRQFGKPSGVFCSTALRARQTAAVAKECFCRSWELGHVPYIEIESLRQWDSGDIEPSHADADEHGVVKYLPPGAPPSRGQDWLNGLDFSRRYIRACAKEFTAMSDGRMVVWIFNHRPITAAAMLLAQRVENPSHEQLRSLALSKAIMPFVVVADDLSVSMHDPTIRLISSEHPLRRELALRAALSTT